MNKHFNRNGFVVFKSVFSVELLQGLRRVVDTFHQNWVSDNTAFYQNNAVNSAYLTGSKYLNDQERLKLFQFIAGNAIQPLLSEFFSGSPAFMGTQLFFNPVNPSQKNYWHRDCQYHLELEQQKKALTGPQVLHFRIPLAEEPGIELVPGSHRNWDTAEELDVRLARNGKNTFDDLSSGHVVPLQVGDVLVFSANMLHRGLYGLDRFALDIILCDPAPELREFIRPDCLPTPDLLTQLDVPEMFRII